jgi:hypothetical protein
MSENSKESSIRPHTGPDLHHPAWCDPKRCTGKPAATTRDGYRAVGAVGAGEHRSAPVPLDLAAAWLLPDRSGSAYLSQGVAPWTCSTYLRVEVGAAAVALPVDAAQPVLAALSALLLASVADAAVSR